MVLHDKRVDVQQTARVERCFLQCLTRLPYISSRYYAGCVADERRMIHRKMCLFVCVLCHAKCIIFHDKKCYSVHCGTF